MTLAKKSRNAHVRTVLCALKPGSSRLQPFKIAKYPSSTLYNLSPAEPM